MSGLTLDRRSFIKGLLTLTTSSVVKEVIPFNRIWFFPKSVIPINYALGVKDDWKLISDPSPRRRVYRGNFAQLLAPGIHQVFMEYLKDEKTAKEYFDAFKSV